MGYSSRGLQRVGHDYCVILLPPPHYFKMREVVCILNTNFGWSIDVKSSQMTEW